jgi:hypothetical protein
MFCLCSDPCVHTLLAATASVGELALVSMRCWKCIDLFLS